MMKQFFITTVLAMSAFLFQPLFGQSLNLEWAINMGGNQSGSAICSVRDIVCDKDGNVFVAGEFNRTVDFNPGSGVALISSRTDGFTNSIMDAFLAKYDANGTFLWVKGIGSGSQEDESGNRVAVDTIGNVYIVGTTGRTNDIYFDTGVAAPSITVGTSRHTDAFVAKYDTDGNFEWARNFGGNGSDAGWALAVNQDGSGIYTGAMVSQNTSTDTNGILIVKYDDAGNETWRFHIIGDDGMLNPTAIALDSEENFVITGSLGYASTVDFNPQAPGTTIVNPSATLTPFLAKYDSTGDLLWVEGKLDLTQPNGRGSGLDVTVDNDDNIVLVGYQNGTLNFDSTNTVMVTTNGSNDGFIAKYTPSGNCIWAHGYGSNLPEGADGVTTDRSGNIYMTGSFRGSVDFDPGPGIETLTALGAVDGVWAKYTPDGDFMEAGRASGDRDDLGRQVAVDKSGNLFMGGEFRSRIFSIDPGGDTLDAVGLEDAFVLKFSCNDTSSSLVTIEECNDQYVLNDVVYDNSGIYHQIYPNQSGCDSTIILDLTLHTIVEPQITINVDTLSTVEDYVTYQWLKNGILITGATNEKYGVTENAEYQVIVTNEFGCTDTSEVYEVTNQDDTDIRRGSNLKALLRLYPNPTTDGLITISTTVALAGVQLRLLSLTGTILAEKHDLPETEMQVNLAPYPSGIYFVELHRGAEVARFKVVKQ